MPQPFPLASEIPVPEETTAAAKFSDGDDPHLIAEFGGSQLTALTDLAQADAPSQTRWNACIVPRISPAAGKINTLSIRQLAEECGLGASNWRDQFDVGFPIDGDLTQKNTFPRKTDEKPILPRRQLFLTDESRFRGRAPKSGWKNAAQI